MPADNIYTNTQNLASQNRNNDPLADIYGASSALSAGAGAAIPSAVQGSTTGNAIRSFEGAAGKYGAAVGFYGQQADIATYLADKPGEYFEDQDLQFNENIDAPRLKYFEEPTYDLDYLIKEKERKLEGLTKDFMSRGMSDSAQAAGMAGFKETFASEAAEGLGRPNALITAGAAGLAGITAGSRRKKAIEESERKFAGITQQIAAEKKALQAEIDQAKERKREQGKRYENYTKRVTEDTVREEQLAETAQTLYTGIPNY